MAKNSFTKKIIKSIAFLVNNLLQNEVKLVIFPIVGYLISKGAKTEANDNKQTPIDNVYDISYMFLCERDFLGIVEYLILNGANIEAQDKYK